MLRSLLATAIALLTVSAAAQDLYLLDTRTGETRQITSTPDLQEYNPSFSNDGKRIVHDVLGFDPGFFQDLWVTDVRTGTSAPLAGGEGGNDADWSPNGQAIAFDRLPAGDPTVYVVDADGGMPTAVAADAYDPSWSGTSRRIAFTSTLDGSIRTVGADGSDETVVAPAGMNPAWSPNGQYIAYSVPDGGGNSLYCVRVGTDGAPRSAPVRLTSGPFFDQQPSWADSKTIVFHSNRAGDFDLYRVDCRDPQAPVRIGGNPGTGDYDPGAQRQFVAYSGSALPPPPAASARGRSGRSVAATEAWPNPFRTATAVRVEVGEAASVRVDVFDVTGRRVATLLDATLEPGAHRAEWAPAETPPGVYLVRVQVGAEVTTHRLTLVR